MMIVFFHFIFAKIVKTQKYIEKIVFYFCKNTTLLMYTLGSVDNLGAYRKWMQDYEPSDPNEPHMM